MKKQKLLLIVLFALVLSFAMFTPQANAVPEYYTFEISLFGTKPDLALSNIDWLGYDDWYQWLYRVDVVEDPGGDNHQGFSHGVVEMESCYGEDILGFMEATAGANGIPENPSNLFGETGDQYRQYTISSGTDGSTGTWGFKWDIDAGSDALDEIDEYDYFWFSAPTDQSEENWVLVKHGGNQTRVLLETPECPECPVIPEPMTLSLLGMGLIGLLGRKKLRKRG